MICLGSWYGDRTCMLEKAPVTQTDPAVAVDAGSPALALRYAFLGLLALLLCGLARPIAWLPAWLALALLLVSFAYATNRVGLLGKRTDGTIAPLQALLLLPYLLSVWSTFALIRTGLRREPCWHAVVPGLYIGRRPRRAELPDDCAMIVDLTAEFIEPGDVVAACRYRSLPTLDRHVPLEANFTRLVRELLAFDGSIYIHCGAGRGRSAMLVAALLVLRGFADDVVSAEAMLRERRPGVAIHPAQRRFIARHCAQFQRAATPNSPSQCA